MENKTPRWTLFLGERQVASGAPTDVASAALDHAEADGDGPLLAFDDATGKVIDLDLRGGADAVAARYAAPPTEPRGRGRPKLGVTAREVTLLPRHWEWLAAQPGGASVALRKLVEQASRDGAARRRAAQETAYRFMSAMAGDLVGYEDAIRALFASDREGFETKLTDWPTDVAAHARRLAWPDI